MSNLKVTINGKELVVTKGTTIAELLLRSKHPGKFPALGAVISGQLYGLYHRLRSDAEIKTLDFSAREGMDIYRRTASLILYAALHDICPKTRVSVGQSLSDGYFFELHNQKIDKRFLKELESRMKNIVTADIPLSPEWKSVEEAIAILKREKQFDKIALLEQIRQSDFPIIELDGYFGCVYGHVAYRTGLIDRFSIYPYEHGLVLAFPDDAGKVPKGIPEQPKLFSTYLETRRWYELMKVENVAQLNDHCTKGTIFDLVKVAETLHERKIGEIADKIISNKNIHLILIAGPSGSGKTTFMKRLAIQLRVHGLEPTTISIDNYYIDRDKTPKHDDGTYNFETINALDIKLLNKNLSDLLEGKEAEIPYYSFVQGKRDPSKSKKMKLGKNK